MLKKTILPSIIALSVILTMAIPVVHAGTVTNLLATRNMNSWYAYLDGRNSNLVVTLQETVTSKTTLHGYTAEAYYELAIAVFPWWTVKKGNQTEEVRGKYQKLIYEKAVIETRGNVATKRFDANPFAPIEKAGPGLAYLRVSAETATDQRRPPREVREYTLILHLTGVVGVLQDGTRVSLGDFAIFFTPLQFVFFHDPAALPPFAGRPDTSGQVPPREKTGSENIEGPTPILTSEETIVDPSVPVFPIFPLEGGDGTVIGQDDLYPQ